jgi:glycosyltransferase involved in cell wall biosynthesis
VRPYFAAIDMLAAPTLVTETFGRVSIEAQASGVPVLCSNLGGLPETMEPDVTGMLLPVGDVAAWRDTILDLAQNKQLRRQLQSKGRDWVGKNFRTEEIAKQFAMLLQDAEILEVANQSTYRTDRLPNCSAIISHNQL